MPRRVSKFPRLALRASREYISREDSPRSLKHRVDLAHSVNRIRRSESQQKILQKHRVANEQTQFRNKPYLEENAFSVGEGAFGFLIFPMILFNCGRKQFHISYRECAQRERERETGSFPQRSSCGSDDARNIIPSQDLRLPVANLYRGDILTRNTMARTRTCESANKGKRFALKYALKYADGKSALKRITFARYTRRCFRHIDQPTLFILAAFSARDPLTRHPVYR